MRARRNRETPSWWNDPKADRAIQRRVRRYNLLGILILIIVLVSSTNFKGCLSSVSDFMNRF
ncbi:Uncharacterized [Syntrophomonas zehnderi OL-4]|uniref:Uncharacterized n=1 Tax=Syntrophomonas zehnderi OL-4 TaxID=690567 RepID=A0A0E4C835_9FIRM|nr:Uncharacterized [Syntrophomonas zehnderi OL-4]